MKPLHRFEHWFNRRFGWFFTNGNKQTLWVLLLAATTLTACHREQVCGTVVDSYVLIHEHHLVIKNEETGEITRGPVAQRDWSNTTIGERYCLTEFHWGTAE